MPEPAALLYSKEHEWVKIDGDTATVGITDYAQASLGDIVYVELPRVGATLQQFGSIGVVESVKAVSDIYTPVGGEVLEVNAALADNPAVLNRAPFEDGWLFKLKMTDVNERDNLLSATAYDELTKE
ncbi:MAG: glycine cleavage system protein GcvH [Candidatus Velthaea sp.]